MDQSVVDQLSLDAIPYYQEQLLGALSIVLELQNKIEAENIVPENIVVKIQDDNKNEIYQHVLDFDEKNIDEVIQEMNEKCLSELQVLDQESYKQDEQIFTMNHVIVSLCQKIDDLEEMVSQLTMQTNKNQVILNQLNSQIQAKKMQLQEINLEILEEEQMIKQNQQIIKRKKKQEKLRQIELDERELLKQKKQEQKQLIREKNAQNDEKLLQQLTLEKNRIQRELDEFVIGQDQKMQQLLSQMETTVVEEEERSIVASVAYERREIKEEPKNRACCGECTIF